MNRLCYGALLVIILGFLVITNVSADDRDIQLTWTAPTTYVDGTVLPESEIASYKCYWRQKGESSWRFAGFAPNSAVSAVYTMDVQLGSTVEASCSCLATNGLESAMSQKAEISIPAEDLPPMPPGDVQGFLL